MSSPVAIIGGGKHAKIIIDILRLNQVNIIGIYDDLLALGHQVNQVPVIGRVTDIIKSTIDSNIGYICAIGDNQIRRKIVEQLKNKSLNWVNAIHPSAIISPNVKIGYGISICAGAVIQTDTVINHHSIINTRASVDHDCLIGQYVHLAPGTTLCGTVTVGDLTFIGAGSTVINNITIGSEVIIGAHSNVIRNPGDKVKIWGNPARDHLTTQSEELSVEKGGEKKRWFKRKNNKLNNKLNQSNRSKEKNNQTSPRKFDESKRKKWPVFESDEIDSVVDVLKSGRVNYWTGNQVKLFEQEFAQYVGTKHAIALANGSLALELALYAIDLEPGDEVIVTPRSFIASASCVVLRGGVPVFAEIDPDSQNITAESIKQQITERTKAVICVHLAGWPCQMDEINQLCRQRQIYVIEDCAQAHGARYQDRPVGSWGDIACWSFCQDKIITTGGEGGMITLNDDQMYQKAWSYKDHGKDYQMIFNPTEKSTGYRRIYTSFGTNWRLTEMQAAIGRRMLSRLDQMVQVRQDNAAILINGLQAIQDKLSSAKKDLTIRVPVPKLDVDGYHAYYRFYFFVSKMDQRDQIIDRLKQIGLPAFTGSCSELYLEEAFDQFWSQGKSLEISQRLGQESVALLVDQTITREMLEETLRVIEQVLCS